MQTRCRFRNTDITFRRVEQSQVWLKLIIVYSFFLFFRRIFNFQFFVGSTQHHAHTFAPFPSEQTKDEPRANTLSQTSKLVRERATRVSRGRQETGSTPAGTQVYTKRGPLLDNHFLVYYQRSSIRLSFLPFLRSHPPYLVWSLAR